MPRHRFQNLTFHKQIEAAIPIARAMLIEGIDTTARSESDIVSLVDGLARLETPADLSEAAHADLWERLEAARAIGIALGLMLRAGSFLEAGGAQ